RGPDRPLPAVLVVHGRHRYLPRRRGRRPVDRPGRQGGARLRAARRDRRSRGERAARRRRTVRGASVRGGRVRALPARGARAVKALLSTDGGARANPGPAAYGYARAPHDGTVLAAPAGEVGVATHDASEGR